MRVKLGSGRASGLLFFFDNLAAKLDALVADIDRAGAGDQATDFLLALATE